MFVVHPTQLCELCASGKYIENKGEHRMPSEAVLFYPFTDNNFYSVWSNSRLAFFGDSSFVLRDGRFPSPAADLSTIHGGFQEVADSSRDPKILLHFENGLTRII